MIDSTNASFPKGILMIGRFFLLFIFIMIFRYYNIKTHTFQLPEHHLIKTTFDILYIIGGFLLLSKKVEYIRVVPFIIAAIMVSNIVIKALNRQLTDNIIFLVLAIVLQLSLIIYIRKELKLYSNKNIIA